MAKVKARSQCKVCKESVLWHSGHHSDGFLKPGMDSSKTLLEASKFNSMPQRSDKKSVTFHMEKFNSFKDSKNVNLFVLLLDNSSPYSGLGYHALKLLSTYLNTNWYGKLDPLPESVSSHSHSQY